MKRSHSDTDDGGSDNHGKRAKHSVTLYWNPDSSHSRLAQVFATAVGAETEYKVINLTTGEHKSVDYLKVNPAGQVPALTDGDVQIAESSSIMRYLAHKYPTHLYPVSDLHKLGRIDYANEYIRQKAWDPSNGVVYQTKWAPMFSGKPADPAVVQAANEKCAAALDRLTDMWFKESDKHVVGTELSMADVTLAVLLDNVAKHGNYDLSKHPKLQHFFAEAKKALTAL